MVRVAKQIYQHSDSDSNIDFDVVFTSGRYVQAVICIRHDSLSQ